MSLVVEVFLVTTPTERAEAYGIREQIFVIEQGVPPEIELDEFDATADHFLARVDGRPTGAGRLVVGAGVGILGRLAVLEQARGAGLGAALVRVIEEQAHRRGLVTVELHAQTHARGFYERLGYTVYGEEYVEVGMPHVSMRKILTDGGGA